MSLSLLSLFLLYRCPFRAPLSNPNSLHILYVLVSFATAVKYVTQRSSPLAAVSGKEGCVTTLITDAKETIYVLVATGQLTQQQQTE